MADFVSSLVEMGFGPDQAKQAVEATGNISVETALEWIMTQEDDVASATPQAELRLQTDPSKEKEPIESGGSVVDTQVRSYKCDDCGKQLKDETEMEYHAAKTQHMNFSESNEEKKPLTAEEKAAQLKRIEQKLKEKRAEREAKEKEEALEREKMRIRSGKDLLEAKKRIEEQQMKELIDARRREKAEDKAARDRVRAQIEADKAARKAKQAGEQGTPTEPATTPSRPTSQPGEKKDYKETKLQLRLPNGKALVQSFGVQEPLSAVRLFIQINRDDGGTGPFNLMSSFPRRVFEGEDYNSPLDALGLVPSAVLMVTRAS